VILARLADDNHVLVDDFALVDEQQMRQQVLDFLDLMRADDDGAAAVVVVVEQAVVESLAVHDVEAEGGLVEHEQAGVDGHDHRQVQLGDHALGQGPDALVGGNIGGGEQLFGAAAVEAEMHGLNVVEQLPARHPARQAPEGFCLRDPSANQQRHQW